MNRFYSRLILGFTVALVGCDSGSNAPLPHFVSPKRLLINSSDVTIDGSSQRLGYVANFANGTVAILNVRDRRVLDTDRFDGEDTPITVGGTPMELFEWTPANKTSDLLYKVGVIDQQNRRLLMFDAVATVDQSINGLSHRPADLGGTEIATASRPIFFDGGRQSNPTISEVTLTGLPAAQNWRLEARGGDRWRVIGSISGTLATEAISGTPYTSPDGSLSFVIQEGDLVSTSGDIFFFGTLTVKPFTLPGTPDAAVLAGDILYFNNRESQTLESLDLNSMTLGTPTALLDGTGETVIPTALRLANGKIFITNRGNGKTLLIYDINSAVLSPFNVGFASRDILVKSDASQGLLFSLSGFDMPVFDTVSGAISGSAVAFAQQPLVATFFAPTAGVTGDMVAVTAGKTVDLIDTTTRLRVDTRDRGDTESFASRTLFFDLGADSSPSMGEVVTLDGKTRTEKWVITYEGIVANTPSLAGVVNGNQLQDSNADFLSPLIKAGDLVIIYPNDSVRREEIPITSLDSATTLTLERASALSGSDIPYEIRVPKAYTLAGSVSGAQINRPIEGLSSNSDNGEITFSISAGNPATTRDDYFTFDTDDGITPIDFDGNLPVDIQIFENYALVVNQGSGNISRLNLQSLRLDGVIN